MKSKKAAPPKKTAKKTAKKRTKAKPTALITQPHGGAIYQGPAANPVAGPGRPRDELRARLLELASGKGVPFLNQLMDGKIDVAFYTTCPKCKHERELPENDEYLDKILDRIGDQVSASIDQRLKGLDQAMKYGVGTKEEIDIMSHPDAVKFSNAYRDALLVEGHEVMNRVMQRVSQTLGLNK